jgi:pimeloyl-ACP methyl ester carboxylesterase
MKRIWLFLLAGFSARAWLNFKRWRQETSRNLLSGSHLAQTERGVVEYGRFGSGFPVLVTHGGPGGYDQGFLLVELAQSGFTVITPSRPGYLRTPLATGSTFAEQADALVALLDCLGIAKTAVLGLSAGGPVALQLALRHPERVAALVLESAVSQAYAPPDAAWESGIGRLFLSDNSQELLMWLLNRTTHRWPRLMFKEYLKLESTFNKQQIQARAAQLSSDPQQVRRFIQLADSLVPMSLRKEGLQNDIAQLATISPYPLEKITAPTLVMHSPYDKDVPFHHAQFVADTVPGAEVFAIAACGHFLWLGDEAKKVSTKRLAFLKQFWH